MPVGPNRATNAIGRYLAIATISSNRAASPVVKGRMLKQQGRVAKAIGRRRGSGAIEPNRAPVLSSPAWHLEGSARIDQARGGIWPYREPGAIGPCRAIHPIEINRALGAIWGKAG